MTDLQTGSRSPQKPDEQSVHRGPISDNTPGWYSDALAGRKLELATVDLKIPDWYKKASFEAKDRLKEVHRGSRQSLNELDQMFSGLKTCDEFAEPLLVAAIQKKFNQQLDVRAVFFARRMKETECDPQPVEIPISSTDTQDSRYFFYKGISLLEAALANFAPDEAKVPVCLDCHLITRYDFYRHANRKYHGLANVKALKLDIKAFEFAEMCRDLDLGRLYFEHVQSVINTQIEDKPSGALTGKFYSNLITSHRNQLELAAEVALMKGDIQAARYALIKDILINQTGRKWGEDDVRFSRLRLFSFVVENILIIGPIVWEDLLVSGEFVARPCMVYIPGDPISPLKEYPNLETFVDQLTTQLCKADYRSFFSQFIPLSKQDAFFTELKTLLDPQAKYTGHNADFPSAAKGPIARRGGYATPLRDVWHDSATRRVRVIMDNTSVSAVSTQNITDSAYNAWLWSWGSKALDILNLAAFVVPFLGEAMMVVGAIQMLKEVAEGIESWDQGDAQTAWAHLSGVALNVAGLAVPPALLAAKNTRFIKRLVHVEFGGRTRLYNFSSQAYKHSITLADGSKPNALGLHAHEGHLYLPATDGEHFKVKAVDNSNNYKLIHPDGDSCYAPKLRSNGAGAWVHEFEQPTTWSRQTLLRRIGHSVDHLSDAQLEQVATLSGVTDDELRRTFVDNQLSPVLFREALRRFEYGRKHQALIDRLSSDTPEVFGRVDGLTQAKLLLESGRWPPSRVLVAYDGESNLVWRSAPVKRVDQVVKLVDAQTSTGLILPDLLEKLSEEEIRQLLDEEQVENRLRFSLNLQHWSRPHYVDELMAQGMQQARQPAQRALRYRDLLKSTAEKSRGQLFEREVADGDKSSDSNVNLIQRSFPGLPKLVAEEIVAHANSEQLKTMADTSRLPLPLAEEARVYLQRMRIIKAQTDLLFGNPLTMDGVHLALHKLASIPGRLEGVCIELRDRTYDGALLDRVGQVDAAKQLRLVRTDMARWALRSSPDLALYWRADKDAFYAALWTACDGRFTDRQFGADTQALKTRIAHQPLSEPQARQALGMQAIKPGFKSPMRLSDGRLGYPLSPVGETALRPNACVSQARYLFPRKSIAEVEAMLGMQGRGDADLKARLNELEDEFTQLQATLETWQRQAEDGYHSNRRRVSATIKYAWQCNYPAVYARDGVFIGHPLDLAGEAIGELPALSIRIDHIGHLKLPRMALSDASLPFLQAFGNLRWLDMSGNNLTQLPEFANGGASLTKLFLGGNDIRLTAASRARLEGMHGLKILDLSGNTQLGWTADLRHMRSLNRLHLRNTGTTEFPAGAEQLLNLRHIDVHSNRITALPEYAYQHRERIIIVDDNPLSVATLRRLHPELPANQPQWGEHVTMNEARESWLRDTPQDKRASRGGVWDSLISTPGSLSFLTVLADTTRSAEFSSTVTRPALAERVWDMLEAVSESQDIRDRLLAVADGRVTCGDGSSVEFMNLEGELLAARAFASVGVEAEEGELIATARKLFRLTLVDAIAQRDVDSRGPRFTEQVEVILAYRIKLADRLGLPVKARTMLFPHQANVSDAVIDEAYTQVLADERDAGAENAFFVGREFWDGHLRQRYPQEFAALMASAVRSIDEETDALYELSRLQGSQPGNADPAAQAQWQASFNSAVDRLVRLSGKRRDEILVDGQMQSGFYVQEMNRLRNAQEALERQALQTLTRKVLNNFAAKQGTEV